MPIPATMQAAFIRETGGTDRIEIGELPVPPLGPTDVLVRMEASEVNHVDLFVRSGAFPTHTPFPFVIGRDLVGTVVEAGSGVAAFAANDRVWCNSLGHDGRQGAFAEYAVVSAERLYPLPPGVAPLEAAAVLHGAATAHIGLTREARLAAGETLLVEGAGGGVGSAVVQMAAARGARVIATASAEDADWCRRCGAEAVFDYHRDDLYRQVQDAAPEGVNVWWDCSGRHDFAHCLPLMAPGGRAVVMAGLQGAAPALPVGAMYTREITLHGFALSNAGVSDLAQAARAINRLLAAGRLKGRIGATYPLAQAAAAHEAMAAGAVRGRIAVRSP
ncbi:NADPH:quinone reductase [Halomonas piscis]|uniref:NADPH:quinone reductase n=1 Tax=Halomonas piscis TaxID=3031727 RepID=A0ABY9Z2Q3_9GAMM|nr:NADPH:quinone reductase [Halomonas piscis]WNK20975.1 NADPH:quinone reductase [Halomonas piscis]